ncbi:MAG: carbohydrate ABC transporter permease [Spirochaetes bacterium]|nr:carbohydrate ABC transporter permease [Spirochaetota bacterium]
MKAISLYILIIVTVLLTIMPFIWMVSTSLKAEGEIFTETLEFIPKKPTIVNYVDLFKKVDFARPFINSVVITIGTILLSLFINSFAAYAFSKINFPGREKLFTLLLMTMMIPGQVTMLPSFLILKNLGLLNNYLGLIIPASASVFSIFLLRQFMIGIPDELLEAARIDGCSEFKIYWKIMLPLCKPVIATLIIFGFMNAWNAFLWPLIVMLDESMYTLPIALANLNGQYDTAWGLLMAGSVVVVLPVIIVFLIMQKQYIKGIATSGIKG